MTHEKFNLYGGDVLLEFVDQPPKIRHSYFVTDKAYGLNKARTDSSTGILGVIDKPFLVPWAAKRAVTAAGWYEREIWTPGNKYIKVPDSVLEEGNLRMIGVLDGIKQMSPDDYWQFLKDCKGAHARERDQSADIGTAVHKWIEKWIKLAATTGEIPELPVENDRMRNGVDSFLKFVEDNNFRFRNSERKVYSRRHQYAGTLDFDGYMDGALTMGDIKTSNMFSPDMFMQTASYQQAMEEEFPHEKYEQNLIVRCGQDGSLEVRIEPRKEVKKDFKAFLGAQAVYRRKQQTKSMQSGNQ